MNFTHLALSLAALGGAVAIAFAAPAHAGPAHRTQVILVYA